MYLQTKLNFLIIFIFFSLTVFLQAKEKEYFLSLKYDTVNVRQGPSKDYPIKFIIKKKYYPVKIIDTFENFRKTIDYNNNSGWIHITQLSKKKSAINISINTVLLNKSKIYSKPLAKLEKGKLVLIKKCKKNWCKVYGKNFSGWVKKNNLWGRF